MAVLEPVHELSSDICTLLLPAQTHTAMIYTDTKTIEYRYTNIQNILYTCIISFYTRSGRLWIGLYMSVYYSCKLMC